MRALVLLVDMHCDFDRVVTPASKRRPSAATGHHAASRNVDTLLQDA